MYKKTWWLGGFYFFIKQGGPQFNQHHDPLFVIVFVIVTTVSAVSLPLTVLQLASKNSATPFVTVIAKCFFK